MPQLWHFHGVQLTKASEQIVARSGRWEFLDTIRGLAALFVILAHGLEQCVPGFLNGSLRFGSPGLVGVVAFFLVSGFIIPVSMERYNSLPRFWLGRAFRLLPMYIFSLLVCVILARLALRPLTAEYDLHPAKYLLIQLTMFQEFFKVPPAIGAYWTLAYELIFCLLCSGLFAGKQLQNKLLWAWLTMVGYLAISIFFAVVFHRSLSATKLAIIVTAFYGALLFWHFQGKASTRSVLLFLLPLFSVFAFVFWLRLTVYPKPEDMIQFTAIATFNSFVVGYVLFGVAYLFRECKFPEVFLWLGRISYSTYLLQGIIISLIPKNSLGFGIFVIGSLVASHLTYTFVEAPIARWQHRVLNARRP